VMGFGIRPGPGLRREQPWEQPVAWSAKHREPFGRQTRFVRVASASTY
jgi:hypothetical protein